ncbi:MAG: pentapeptide repeat-containing protein [Pseudanabaenaceae cyanobacterium bins.68]|nr:pentapeptide repeat-containing protein [Pseudanabaenaceae cyanobacterium bins.68]
MSLQTAANLAEYCDRWTRRHPQSRDFICTELQMAWEIYDQLSLVELTPDNLSQLFRQLETEAKLRPLRLFGRLQIFYERWCTGIFLDAIAESLPHKKSAQVKTATARQIDIGAGLNVMILLFGLDAYMQSQPKLAGKLRFFPCGDPDSPNQNHDSDRLLKIIGYARWLGITTFLDRVRDFLAGAKLVKVNLAGANLFGVNLENADLRGSNLSATNLAGACLSKAELYQTNFSFSNLTGCDFSGANAKQASFNNVNLMSAEMSKAQFQNAKFSNSNLSGVNLARAELNSCDFSNSHLRGAVLTHTNLHRANLRNAILVNADLSHADLRQADLRYADLQDTILNMLTWDQTTKWEQTRGLKLVTGV